MISLIIAVVTFPKSLSSEGNFPSHCCSKVIPVNCIHGGQVDIYAALFIGLDMLEPQIVIFYFIHQITAIVIFD